MSPKRNSDDGDADPPPQHDRDHDDQYEYILARASHITVNDNSPSPSTQMKFNVANTYEWLVNKDALMGKSTFFKIIMDSSFMETQSNTINLPEDEPGLIARMVLFCSYGRYHASPHVPLMIGHRCTRTVIQLLEQGRINPAQPIVQPLEPKLRSMLHLDMYLLADKYDVQSLETYALAEYKKALRTEGSEARRATVERLGEMSPTAMQTVKEVAAEQAAGSRAEYRRGPRPLHTMPET